MIYNNISALLWHWGHWLTDAFFLNSFLLFQPSFGSYAQLEIHLLFRWVQQKKPPSWILTGISSRQQWKSIRETLLLKQSKWWDLKGIRTRSLRWSKTEPRSNETCIMSQHWRGHSMVPTASLEPRSPCSSGKATGWDWEKYLQGSHPDKSVGFCEERETTKNGSHEKWDTKWLLREQL